MAADINTKHLFFKGKQHLLRVLSHIRKLYVKFLLLFLVHNIKETDLPCHVVLFVMNNALHDLYIGAHKLLPGTRKGIKGPCLDKVLNSLFGDNLLICQSGNKVL